MIEIIPAIMPKSYEDLAEKMGLFAGVVPLVQLDIMDGKFVPARTWPYYPGEQHFTQIIAEDEGMPEWEFVDFEADLMVENPEEVISNWVSAGARRIIVHVESMTDFETIRNAVPQDLVEPGVHTLALQLPTIRTIFPLHRWFIFTGISPFLQASPTLHFRFAGKGMEKAVMTGCVYFWFLLQRP